jgi:hypothetical protein
MELGDTISRLIKDLTNILIVTDRYNQSTDLKAVLKEEIKRTKKPTLKSKQKEVSN